MSIKVECVSVEPGVYDIKVGQTYKALYNDDYGYFEIDDDGFIYRLDEVKINGKDGFSTKSFSGKVCKFIAH